MWHTYEQHTTHTLTYIYCMAERGILFFLSFFLFLVSAIITSQGQKEEDVEGIIGVNRPLSSSILLRKQQQTDRQTRSNEQTNMHADNSNNRAEMKKRIFNVCVRACVRVCVFGIAASSSHTTDTFF